ncbi:amidase family protein [Actinoplanes sp. NPDC049548]|uniref:amidase family protein n=1 Tax=Actinoplanes sp. NPDC049548 TaxID=3155152 RepID=UPI00341E0772
MTDPSAGVLRVRDRLRRVPGTDRSLVGADLTRGCLDRIRAANPTVNAVLAVDETAVDQALAADRRRAAGRSRGPLDGIPVLVKDNIDTAGLATTAGSRHLAGMPPRHDAEIVRRLRAAGAVILGKTNLTEWANFRTSSGPEGWSSVGGQTRNPHRLECTPWGSSSGSAAAVAAGMVPLALGTETDGSIVCPAGVNGVVGVKPEIGLLPTDGIVPISRAVDVPGLLATRLGDASTALSVLTGRPDVLAGNTAFPGRPQWLAGTGLTGRRIGLWRVPGMPDEVSALLDEVAGVLEAEIVPVELDVGRPLLVPWFRALYAEFRPSLEAYLRTRTGAPRTLDELIAANRADGVEQDVLEQAAALSPAKREEWAAGRAGSLRAGRDLIDGVLARYRIDAVLAPTNGPAWILDPAAGDPAAPNSSSPAALAGYPNISLPAGFIDGLPIGVSVFGPSRLDRLLPLAAAVERALETR